MVRYKAQFEGEPKPTIIFARSLIGATKRADAIARIKKRKLIDVKPD